MPVGESPDTPTGHFARFAAELAHGAVWLVVDGAIGDRARLPRRELHWADFRLRMGTLGHEVWAVPKRSAPPPPGVSEADAKAWRRWVRSKRALLETVFAMFADQFAVEVTRARSLLGIWTRVVAKVLAFDLGVYLNRLLGQPSLAIKPLFL